MARERINPNIRYYLPGDPYYYEVDNLPLKDLQDNDMSLQEQIDNLNTRIDNVLDSPDRGVFTELLPYFSTSRDGVLRVKDGNFIARVNTKADFENGLMERKFGSDADSVTVSLGDPGAADMARILEAGRTGAEQFEAKSSARNSVIEYLDAHEIEIPTFDDKDFTDSDAPDFRVDLLYIQASPGMDETNERVQRFGNVEDTARLGYVRGGYFRVDTTFPDRNEGSILSFDGLDGKVVGLSQVDIVGRGAGTIPAPDDIVNKSHKDATTPAGAASHTPGISTFPLDVWAEQQLDNLGVFCLPVAYIRVPRGYVAGTPLPQDNLIDIRPFFRSAELTLSERQAIATAHAPSLGNRFMTVTDPDYAHLKNVTVKGLGTAEQQDHEGRIQSLEAKMREQADVEIFQPVNIACMEGQETEPFYLNQDETNADKLSGFRDFLPAGGTGNVRRNNETYKKTVRAIRYKAGPGQWMLYTQISFFIADETKPSARGAIGAATNVREGAESNNPGIAMPSGYYRLNITELGYTGAGVDSILATPHMEEKWGGDAWAFDIMRHSDYVEEGGTSLNPGFIDFDFGCKDTYRRAKLKGYPGWNFWRGNKWGTVVDQEGSLRVNLTLVGLSTTPDLYSGAELATDVVY